MCSSATATCPMPVRVRRVNDSPSLCTAASRSHLCPRYCFACGYARRIGRRVGRIESGTRKEDDKPPKRHASGVQARFCGPVLMRIAPLSSFKPQDKQNGEEDAENAKQRGTLLREAGSEQGKDVLVLLAAAHAHGPRREDLSCRPPTVARAAAALRGGLS